MNMYKHELKTYRKTTIIWNVTIVLVISVFMALFPAFSKDAKLLQDMFKGFPEAFLRVFGLATLDISKVLGFYAFLFLYILICGSIQAMNFGVSVLSVEQRDKTADFLLTKPVDRQKVVTAKVLASITYLVITNIVFFTAAYLSVESVKRNEFSFKIFVMITLSLLFVQLMFFVIGLIISAIAKRIKSVLPVSLGVVFGFYAVSALSSMFDDKKLAYFTPFEYFDAENILKNGSYDTGMVIIAALFVIAGIIASYVIYTKKDISTV